MGKQKQTYVDEAHDLSDGQFRILYHCLLSCHLKFGDLGSALHMVLEMLWKEKNAQNSLGMSTFMFELPKLSKSAKTERAIHRS